MGDYTRTVFEDLGLTDALDNVVSEEQDVKGVVAQGRLGEADAGFVYATDVKPVEDDVRGDRDPGRRRSPRSSTRRRSSTGTENGEAAQAFLERLLGEEGRAALEEAGSGCRDVRDLRAWPRGRRCSEMSKAVPPPRPPRALGIRLDTLGAGIVRDASRPSATPPIDGSSPRPRSARLRGRPCRAAERSEPLRGSRPGGYGRRAARSGRDRRHGAGARRGCRHA